jgi:prolyl oligopeptidase
LRQQNAIAMTLRFLGVYFLFCTTLFAQSGKTNVFRDTVSDVYFSDKVSDPYQWMEGATDPHLAPWLEQQQKKTSKKQRSFTHMWTLRAQLATVYNKGKVEARDNYVEKDGRFQSKYEFDSKNVSDKRTADLRYRVRGAKNYRSLVKIKSLQKFKKEHILIHEHIVNTSLDLVAIVISRDGTDWREVHFYNLLTGEKLEDQLQYLRNSSSIVWDGNGLYYDRYSTPINVGGIDRDSKGANCVLPPYGKGTIRR